MTSIGPDHEDQETDPARESDRPDLFNPDGSWREGVDRMAVNPPLPWLPTAANINALAEPVRRYIHDLETRADPAGDVLLNWQLKQQLSALEAMYINLRDKGPDNG